LRDGPVSLGELRRSRNWQPEALLRVAREHPDGFTTTSVIEGGHQHPAIEISSELSDEARKFVKMVREGGKAGVAGAKIWRLHQITTARAVELAGEFPDLVEVRQTGTKTMFLWKPKLEKATMVKTADSTEAKTPTEPPGSPPGTFSGECGMEETAERGSESLKSSPSASEELQEHRDQLAELCKDGRRNSHWLSEKGFDVELLVLLVRTFPETFAAEVVQLSRDPSGAFLQIGLRQPEQEPESRPVEPAPSQQVPLSELVPQDQLARMRFKPASPDMARSRNDPRFTRGGIQRRRQPLVEI
jgi:hypothetical protein